MAKIKMGAIVVAMSGKLGGHVFARNTGGAYMRTKVTPVNPQSTFQTTVRSIFAAISSAWSGLTEQSRDSFRSKVADYARTNIFGDLKNPTGKALYQRLNQNLEISEQAQITVAPAPIAIPSALIDDVVFTLTTAYNILTEGDSTGSKILVSATPVLSQGTKFVKNKLRLLKVADGGIDVLIDIKAEYDARFGLPVAGDNVYVSVKYVNSQGQASPLQIFKAFLT